MNEPLLTVANKLVARTTSLLSPLGVPAWDAQEAHRLAVELRGRLQAFHDMATASAPASDDPGTAHSLEDRIRALRAAGNGIQAVRLYRDVTHLDLRSCLDAVNRICADTTRLGDG
jgi:hypothetical protein